MKADANDFVLDHEMRRELFEASEGLCKCWMNIFPDKEKDICCECVLFQKTTACPHSYLLKYGEVTKADSNREAVARFKKKREKKMHYKWGDTKSIFR